MNSGKNSEKILSTNEEYQRFKGISEREIKTANEQLARLRPKLEEVRAILAAVGC